MCSSILVLGSIIALIGYYVYHLVFRKTQLKLPPGPKPLPILGNVRDLPPEGIPECEHWLKHKDLYGPVSSVTVLGTTLIILHDKQAVQYLLEKNAGKTADRPRMAFLNKMCGYEKVIVCQRSNELYYTHRKLLRHELGDSIKASEYQYAQELEVKRQLVRSLNEPEKWLKHFKTSTSATTLKNTYGYAVEPNKPDILVDMMETVLANFSVAGIPLTWLVDAIPGLAYVPECLPGGHFRKIARERRRALQKVTSMPYEFAKRQMVDSSYSESFVSKSIRQSQLNSGLTGKMSEEDEEAIAWTAVSLYGAADTTVISLHAFTLAMALHPEVQRKAQEEIDSIIGRHRIPTAEDRANLPYIGALVKEVLRWWPASAMGVPHIAEEDLEYENFHIPKGAYLLPAIRWFLHDPEVYENPKDFDPERFLAPRNEPDPSDGFGYGKRKCPGRFYAEANLFINIVSCLAAFKIGKALHEDGNEINIDVKIKPGLLGYLTDFKVKVTPRSQEYVDIIRQFELDHPWDESDSKHLKIQVNGLFKKVNGSY